MKRIKYCFLLALLLGLLAGCGQREAPRDSYVLPTFQLELTPEQARQFASGKFYIMRQFGRDLFLPFYGSEHVRLEGNLLTADFNGKVLYFANDSGSYSFVEALAQQASDEVIQHQTRLVFDQYVSETGETVDDPTTFEIYLAHDRDTGELVNSRVTDPYDYEPVDLLSAEYSPLALPQAKYCTVYGGEYRYITRDENGQPLPLSQWERTGKIWMDIAGGQNAGLVYGDLTTATAPMTTAQGSVVLVFEVTNEDQSGWCSEPITVPLREEAPREEAGQPLQINWTAGNSIRLLEKDGVTVILRKSTSPGMKGISYALELKNDTQEDLSLYVEDLVYNGTVQSSRSCTVHAPGNSWKDTAFSFGPEAGEALQTPLKSISFRLQLNPSSGFYTLWEQDVEVTLSEETAITPYWVTPTVIEAPFREFLAREDQLLLEQDGVRFTLLCMGEDDNPDYLTWLISAENTAQAPRTVKIGGVILNGIFLKSEHTSVLQPGQICYFTKTVSSEELDHHSIQAVSSAALLLGAAQDSSSYATTYCPIAAVSAAEEVAAAPEGSVLWEAQQVRVCLQQITEDAYGDTLWQLVIENTGDENRVIRIREALLDAGDGAEPETAYPSLSQSLVAAHSRVYTQLSCRTDGLPLLVRLRLLNEEENTILSTQQEAIPLPMP